MIQLHKERFKNIYANLTLVEWYEHVMFSRVYEKYKNPIKGLKKKRRDIVIENQHYVENVIQPFFSDINGKLDEQFIKLILNGDIIEILTNYGHVCTKLDSYFYLRLFGYYYLEKIKIIEKLSVERYIMQYFVRVKLIVKEFNKRIQNTSVCIQFNIAINGLYNWVRKSCHITNLKNSITPEIIKKINRYALYKFKIGLVNQKDYIFLSKGIKIRELYFRDVIRFDNMISYFIDYSMLKSNECHIVLSTLDVRVCPYCNRQYITLYKRNNKKVSTADLDHFFPQSRFKLLSLNLYNMVPSCQICNSRMKLEKAVEIHYPYSEKLSYGAEFHLVVKSGINNLYNMIYGVENSLHLNDFNIEINGTGDDKYKKMEGTLELFHLREVYQSHKSYVAELIRTKSRYDNDNSLYILREPTESQLESILSHRDNLYTISNDEKNRMLYKIQGTKDEIPNTPLMKLTIDILKQLS